MVFLKNRYPLICAVVAVVGILLGVIYSHRSVSAFISDSYSGRTVILDAGHGGVDGGASSADGIIESDINLEITKRLALLMIFCGQRVALTRIDAGDLSSPDAQSIREKKVSDLQNRVAAINSISNATLISIHQNSLGGQIRVHGAQVFYNTAQNADRMANHVQQHLNDTVNVLNSRNPKPIDTSIYLMKHVLCPAILVECGFLSNPSEAHKLCTPEHQKHLILAISAGYLCYIGAV